MSPFEQDRHVNMQKRKFTPKAYRARWAMIDSNNWIPNATITISPLGEIVQCESSTYDTSAIDLGEGIIMPMLVNAHTHLELSALKNMVPMDMGFTSWVKHLVIARNLTDPKILIAAAQNECQRLWNTGMCAVGEISSLSLTEKIFAQSGLYGCWFREYFGNDCISLEDNLYESNSSNCYFSLAGHAPHTTSPELFRYLKQAATGKPFSVHVSESDVEMEFITGAKGEWADFLECRCVDYHQWNLPQRSPVKYLDRIGVLDNNTLLVHLLHCDSDDVSIIKARQCPVCVCPRSNYNLHRRLPDIDQMIHSGLTVCLGTDSLASVDSLSIWDEMKYLGRHFPNIPPKKILEMATISGAYVLGHGNQFGRLANGYKGFFLYVPINGGTPEKIANQLVHGEFSINDMQVIREPHK
jgi:cytosine/adenosine deaminase-related metal-dependent hydrolase